MNAIAFGPDAVGFVAVGENATGVIAIGGTATGVIAIGSLARGVLAIGFVAIGLVAIGFPFALGGTAASCGVIAGGRVRGVGLGIGLVNRVVGGGPSWDVPTYPFEDEAKARVWWTMRLVQSFVVAVAVFGGWYLAGAGLGEFLGLGEFFRHASSRADSALGVAVAALTWIGLPFWFRRTQRTERAEAIADAARAQKRRERGSATIKSLQRTGLTVNDQPQVKFELYLDLGDKEGTVEITRLVDLLEIPRVQPGRKLLVRYDPDDLDNLEIDFGETPGEVECADPEALLAEQQKTLDELNETGVAAEAIVNTLERLGIDVNDGEGFMARLTVTVIPAEGGSFRATFPVALAYSRAQNYEPGKRIWVRYDPNDRSRASIDFQRQGGTVSKAD